MEQLDMKVSLGSNLKIYSKGSIKILSRSWDIVEKTLLHNSSPYVGVRPLLWRRDSATKI